MKRLPTLDEIESGHTNESAYDFGDVDALDVLADADARHALELCEVFGL